MQSNKIRKSQVFRFFFSSFFSNSFFIYRKLDRERRGSEWMIRAFVTSFLFAFMFHCRLCKKRKLLRDEEKCSNKGKEDDEKCGTERSLWASWLTSTSSSVIWYFLLHVLLQLIQNHFRIFSFGAMLAHKATVGASERFHFPIATSCILSVSDFIQSLVLLSEIEKMIMLAAEINRNTNKKKWREKNPSICFMLFHQNQSKKLRSNVCLLHYEPIPIKFFHSFSFHYPWEATQRPLSHIDKGKSSAVASKQLYHRFIIFFFHRLFLRSFLVIINILWQFSFVD